MTSRPKRLRPAMWIVALAATIAAVVASAANAETHPSGSRPAKSSAPGVLARPWPQRVIATTNFSDTPVVALGSTIAFGVVPAGSGQHIYGRLEGIDLITGKTSRGPLVFLNNNQLIGSGSFVGLVEPTIEAAGPGGYTARAIPSYWTVHRIEVPSTRLPPGHYLKAFGQIEVAPQLSPANGTSEDFWGASGDRLVLVDPVTGDEVRSIPAPARDVRDLAASPSGSLLFVSGANSQDGAIDLFELDAATGHVLARTSFEIGLLGVAPVATTANDVWIASSGGMSTNFLSLYSSSTLQPMPATPGPDQIRDGRGLDGYTIELFGGTGWVAIPGEISCVSPTTGKVLASALLPANDGDAELITPLAVVGRTLYVVQDAYSGPGSGSVRSLTPPAACFLG